jgi:hypothetical protein
MTQAQVSQELVWLGLGDFNNASDVTKEFEAYGDGTIKAVKVLADGKMIATGYVNGIAQTLWEGYPEDGDEVADIVERFGHYAPC